MLSFSVSRVFDVRSVRLQPEGDTAGSCLPTRALGNQCGASITKWGTSDLNLTHVCLCLLQWLGV